MRILKRLSLVPLLVAGLFLVPLGSHAGSLPAGCTKVQGTITCTTFSGPGNNQAGVGTTTDTQTQGNTSNFSPAPQDPGTRRAAAAPRRPAPIGQPAAGASAGCGGLAVRVGTTSSRRLSRRKRSSKP
jgi:hypothetical protein